jgi:hypothetical protein
MNEVRRCLSQFAFGELFTQHLFWDGYSARHPVEVDGVFYELNGIAQKRGLVVFTCVPASDAAFPGSAERKRIEREVAKLAHEHVIVFFDRERSRQIWQIPRREEGKTVGHSETAYYAGKGVEHLARRVKQLAFTLAESESTTLVEVASRVNQALLAERVTKKFFKEFSDHRKVFVRFLDWIEDESKRDWYCSVLLNRLMFIYFLGGKGFLPGGTNFLATTLDANAKSNGPDTFYTHFLLPLSFFGLGERQGKRGRFEQTFKDVLYLDGGLFTVHQVERELGMDKQAVEQSKFSAGARIPDAEFKRWFEYFDKWRWTLDEDKVENEGYISPHILGYIFEKYINQKQMGAYYTKEDITGYICRNTIIPRLFDMLAESGDKGGKSVTPLPIGPHPNLLNDGRGISDGEGIDRYVYPSVKQEAKLPTETDYEQEQRRKRYESILADFDAGKVEGIDDFITYNLDIEKLALDFVSNIQDPEVLHAFYFKGLQQITVLDPTCGSGAFLFAAMNILFPLYNAALSRMRYLLGKATGDDPDVVNWGGRLHFDDLDVDQSTLADSVPAFPQGSKVLDELRAEVERIKDHPSAEYFIKKSIIVNNLFGVDIMEEAVEICKLRLFLTLISTVERDDSKDNFGVEPLPDIDFNILAGNTLVGYASIEDIDRLWHEVEVGTSTLAFEKDHTRLKSLVAEYGKLLRAWQLQQLGEWTGAPVTKEQVIRAAEGVRPDLDEDLWRLYRTAGLARKTVKRANVSPKVLELTQAQFKRSHEPFHWLLELPSVEASGGFEVIVGNPPYLEASKLGDAYRILGYRTYGARDIYAWVVERSVGLGRSRSRLSLIVPTSLVSSTSFQPLRDVLAGASEGSWYASFSNRPGQLFEGAQNRLTILNVVRGKTPGKTYATRYVRHDAKGGERAHLMESLGYADVTDLAGRFEGLIPKAGCSRHVEVLAKLISRKPISECLKAEGMPVYWVRVPGYFCQFMLKPPMARPEGGGEARPRGEVLAVKAADSCTVRLLHAILNSTTFYVYFSSFTDGRHINPGDVKSYPSDLAAFTEVEAERLQGLSMEIEENNRANTRLWRKSGLLIDSIDSAPAKGILDAVDDVLGRHIGFAEDEIEFIKNYDLKFRINGLPDVSEEDE